MPGTWLRKYDFGSETLLIRISLMILLAPNLVQLTRAQVPHQFGSGYIPQRVYDASQKKFSDFETMLAELARLDVVFVGEQHDDPATHRLERAILEGLGRRRSNIILAMEMFERDVQPNLNRYFAGEMSEEEFLRSSRPWPRYQSDYRPLVEFARAHRWPLIASNVPRRYAAAVSRVGLSAIEAVPPDERKLIASQIQCPIDDYFKRFSETIRNHPGAGTGDATRGENADQKAVIERFYYAQCIKDETMAESIADNLNPQLKAEDKPLIVHFNGSFHSDYRLGAAARTNRRAPKSSIKVVSIIPLDNLDEINVAEYRNRGDYLIFTLKPKREYETNEK
ncbi:MAG: ChaN family lipoprotein [Acidobacteria bacterium]|nr:ChaN family lipoprotein [Acidobacteriota bacterium]